MHLNADRARRIFVALLLAAALLRLLGINWDAGHHLHPDERFISMVEEKLDFPASPAAYFDSARSPLNPYNRGHDSFVYGTLPMFVTKAVARAIGRDGYGGAHLVGRALSGFADLLSVWLTYLLVRRLGGRRRIALCASALYAFSPLAIQLSHFWTVETFLTAFSTLTLLGAVRIALGRARLIEEIGVGIALGLAVACKVTALALLLPVGIALLVRLARSAGQPGAVPLRLFARAAAGLAVVAAAAAITVRIALPYAFAGPGLLSFQLDPRYVADLKRLAQLSSSVAGFPPALQWAGRTIVFPIRNFVAWAAGPFFGISALAGLVWATFALRRKINWPLAPLVAYALFLFLYHGTAMVKSLRYFMPAYPALAVLAALALSALAVRYGALRGARGWVSRHAPALVAAGALFCALAFTSIYRRPHPRVEAAKWIYSNAPAGARFGNETWDDALPLPMPGYDVATYAGPAIDLWGPDSADKVNNLVQTLEKADWIAVTSNRVYANITRLPAVFPMTTAYYRALFDGRLGFERAAEFTSYPSLGPLRFPDDRAEEQFTVYDHPRVLLFRKTPSFSAERARKMLLASMPQTPLTIWEWEKQPRSKRSVGSSLVPERRSDVERDTKAALPSLGVGSIGAALLWYAALLAIGILAFPVAYLLFPRLEDRGAGIARVFGLLLATFLQVVAVQSGLMENGRRAAFFAVLLIVAAATFATLADRKGLLAFLRERRGLIGASEAAFAAGFLLFLGIRALNPEIFWGEKPMDFSILNVLVRTRTLPASDPWFAGVPLGYYAFGQQAIAFLTLLTGLSTAFTFNLAFGLLGGTILQASFTLGRNWTGSWKAGIAGASLTVLIGNLSGLREWLVNHRPIDWHYFWATSRVIKDTINEYPFWSLVFADLHAHVLAIPLFLFVATAALHFVRVHSPDPAMPVRRLAAAIVLGFAAAGQALTNAWDVPLLTAVLGICLLAAAAATGRPSRGSLGRALVGAGAAVTTALVLGVPLWIRGGGRPGFGRNADAGAAGLDVLTVFGLFFLLAFAWLLRRLFERLEREGVGRTIRLVIALGLAAVLAIVGVVSVDLLCVLGVMFALVAAADGESSGEDRLALGLLALGFLLVLFPQRFYVSDRMNTFFKLYLEAWLVFAVATTALVFRSASRPGAFARWPRSVRALAVLVGMAAFFTSVTALYGALGHHFAPYSGPSLDGLRYLGESRPGEHRAVLWLRRSVRGTPVVLEAQGDSYQDFSRISMLTGLPTVLGWEHHVKQRGNPEEEVATRREAVRQIYTAKDASRIESLLRRYHVGYVYVGWLERQTYPGDGLKKFDRDKELFELAYVNADARIYRVVGGDSDDVIAPAREELPPPAPGQEILEAEEPPSILETADAGEPWSGMREPRDAALDGMGRIWIADFGNSRLRIFDAEGGYLGGWGGRGNGTYQLREPCAVAVRGENLYVADTWNGRVQFYSIAGEWKTTAAGLYGPRGVAVAPDGRVWVTDTGNNRVIVYDASLSQPQPIGKAGKGRGEFMSPVGIAVESSGSIYVADVGNRRVQVLDASGTWQRDIPIPWTGTAIEPHVEISGDGTLYVTDPEGAQVLEFDPSGNLSRRWTEDSSGQKFSRPTGLALSGERDTLYVVNSGTSRVSTLELR